MLKKRSITTKQDPSEEEPSSAKLQKATIRQPVARIGSNNTQKKRSLKDIIGGQEETPIAPPNLEFDDDMINPTTGAFAALSRGNSTLSKHEAVLCPNAKKQTSYRRPVLKTNISELFATNPNKMNKFGSLIQKKAVDTA